ncbi:hypothetical protein GDO86_010123 [Hymenochirus boettgeri]|uniref:Uncharacterized protein n=1 Tax=Hymenochirus boettgeri TaxID=247094 RepID=A0A8T2JPD2_9PIPI|nr:hypothetical protein GDO86_010123 [Hymenochirus boettgeri]
MLLFLLKAVLLCFPWGPLKTSAIVSLTSTPLFTMDALNSSESEEPKQAFTVLLDVSHGTTESDTATDGGTQESAVTSMLTPVANNVAGGVENTIKVQELTPTSIDPTQLISPGLFTNTNIEKVFSTQDSPSKDIGNNTTVIPLLENNKAPPYDDPIYSFLEIPRENNTTEKQCFCNIPGPEGQKGDKGERGDPGSPGIVGENGQQGFEGTKGNQGQKGSKGEKGQKGSKGDPGEIGVGGPKGEPGDTCPFCEKGEKGNKGRGGFLGFKGEKGEPGFKGDLGPKGNTGEKGSSGAEGPPGKSGEVGQKGSMGLKGSIGLKGNRGIPGSLGAPGVQGLAGMPGRKGEKGEKGACAGHENIAFSVGLEQQNNILLPGSPLKFDKIFCNYCLHSGRES